MKRNESAFLPCDRPIGVSWLYPRVPSTAIVRLGGAPMGTILVAYATRLGATRGIALRIGGVLQAMGHEAVIQSVDEPVDLRRFDAVVLGSGIFGGHWHKPATAFAYEHSRELAALPLWLFSDGPVGSIAADRAPTDSPDARDLVNHLHARDHRVFFGALDRSKVDRSDLSRFEKAIAKRFVPEGDWRDWPAIEAWADTIGRAVAGELVPA
jgi:menaquinone-dependent protoporphyrinogen oxidase